ncbi:MAG: FecR domain-containing protein [Deltaproteobacteria bacterium]
MSRAQRPERLEDTLRPAVDERFVADVWERIESTPPRRSPLPLLVGAVAIAAVGAFTLLRTPEAPPVVAEAPTIAAGRTTTLADGSRITLSDDAEFEVLVDDLHDFVLVLDGGVVRLDVRPSARRWIVDAGVAKIEVVGTRFSVERRDDRVDVEVERGAVQVSSRFLDGDRRLEDGTRLTIQPPAPASDAGVTKPKRVPSAAKLLEAADAARREGDDRRAVRALQRLLDEHPKSDEAGYAAFTLAAIAWETGETKRAIDNWERAIEAGLPESLERAAYSGLLDAHAKSGDSAAGERVQQRFRQRFGEPRSDP